MILKFRVYEQTISLQATKSEPRQGSKDYLELQFSFSSDWNDLLKYVYLQHGEVSIPHDLTEGSIIVDEYFTEQTEFNVTLFGRSADGSVEVPTNVITVFLKESNNLWEKDAPAPQNSWVVQVIDARDAALAAAIRAENAAIHQPYPNSETGTWWVWNADSGAYKDTGVSYGGGSSPDAVLYTQQTLTDTQKKQARENIDAASSDFVITGTVTGETLTTDKTYEQVHEAVQAGKRVTLKVKVYGIDFVLSRIGENSSGYLFATAATIFPTVTRQFSAVVGASGTLWHTEQVASYDSNGNLVQNPMDRDPEQPMEIATKQYVDAHATGGTDMGITGAKVGQIAKITAVDDTGKPTEWEAVDMPTGGNGEEMRVIKTITITADDVNSVYFNRDDNGLPFALTKHIRIRMYGAATNTGSTQAMLFFRAGQTTGDVSQSNYPIKVNSTNANYIYDFVWDLYSAVNYWYGDFAHARAAANSLYRFVPSESNNLSDITVREIKLVWSNESLFFLQGATIVVEGM